jgi:hypothetical protein
VGGPSAEEGEGVTILRWLASLGLVAILIGLANDGPAHVLAGVMSGQIVERPKTVRKRKPAVLVVSQPVLEFLRPLVWLDGTPLLDTIEEYRRRLFVQMFDERDPDDTTRPRYSMLLAGRGKKGAKSLDAVLAALIALLKDDSIRGNTVYLLASDEGQATDDFELLVKLLRKNPHLLARLTIHAKEVRRRDGGGVIRVLPAGDVEGLHGKSYRLAVFDEIHTYRTWDVLEALAPDMHRVDAQQWITSYASIYNKPGVPLFDLCAIGRRGEDPGMLFSWYSSLWSTDPAHMDPAMPPELRANPTLASVPRWETFIEGQRRRLPFSKFRRLFWNEPGVPEGSVFAVETIMDAIDRGVPKRAYIPGVRYVAFVDMSGGSSDSAVLCIAHVESYRGRVIVDLIMDQGPPPPFNPRDAVARFVTAMREYRIGVVVGDKFAGTTFAWDFQQAGVRFRPSTKSAADLYLELEPKMTAGEVRLVDQPLLEQQLLGLVWRGHKPDHLSGEHDDWSNAMAGAVVYASDPTLHGPTVRGGSMYWDDDGHMRIDRPRS